MKQTVPLAIILCATTVPVMADDCKTMQRQVEEALAKAVLKESDKSKVASLQARGEEERLAGNDFSCQIALEELLELLKT